MARLGIAARAEQDLDEIADFVSAYNPVAARSLVAKLRQRINVLGAHPLAGRARDEFGAGLRSIAFGRYVVVYRVMGDEVIIARILHGSRDIRRALTGR